MILQQITDELRSWSGEGPENRRAPEAVAERIAQLCAGCPQQSCDSCLVKVSGQSVQVQFDELRKTHQEVIDWNGKMHDRIWFMAKYMNKLRRHRMVLAVIAAVAAGVAVAAIAALWR